MKKNNIYIIVTILFFTAITKASYAQNPLIDFLEKMEVIEGAGKSHIYSTYEDVEPIKFNPKTTDGSLPFITQSSIPAYTITSDIARPWFDKLIPPAILSDDYGSLADFISKHFYIDYGGLPEEPYVIGTGHPTTKHTVGFPHQDEGANNATSKKYYLCLSAGNYQVINSPITFSHDVYKCVCGAISPTSVCHRTGTGSSHATRPAYTNFRERVLGTGFFSSPTPITRDDNIYCKITYRDRTPPWIKTDEEGRFPTLGKGERKVYTEDFYKLSDLKVFENRATKVLVKMALGRIYAPPRRGNQWKDKENWSETEAIEELDTTDTGSETNFATTGSVQNVIIPNCNIGYMRYSVFLQDTNVDSNEEPTKDMKNLNPGCATIVEDEPGNCYGLPGGEDLGQGNDPGGARPWPHSELGSGIDGVKFNINTITGDNRVLGHEGLIKISDNDLPNILIKITSSRDGESLFFPPCMPAGSLTIKNSPDYYGKTDSNQGDYNYFVGSFISAEFNYDSICNSYSRPYYRIFDLKPSIFMNSDDLAQKNRFINNRDPRFINQNFRLEDQTYSDTDRNGDPDTSEDNLGKRNGTWQEVVALIDNSPDSRFKIQEDVEYKFSIWFDDSVKWANSFNPLSNSYMEQVESIPSGIKRVSFKLDIPNQRPAVVGKTYSVNPEKSIKDGINIVFREPTKDIAINSVADLETHNFPSITVEAEDFAGLKRKIKLYFKVSDENANLRTLQRKHEQH